MPTDANPAAPWMPAESDLRAAGLIPAERMMTRGIWQNTVRGQPGPLYLVLLAPNTVSVGPHYGPALWRGPLRNSDELARCVRHYAALLAKSKTTT